jgi:ketosteroid isomerase-like protein
MKIKTLIFLLIIIFPAKVFAQKVDDSKNNIKVVANYFEYLFKKGDFTSLEKIIAKNAIYTQADGLPYGGKYTGFEEWVKMFISTQKFCELKIGSDPIYFTNTTNSDVLVHFTVKFKANKSGKELTMMIAEYFEVKENQITSIRPFYFDTKTFTDFIK